MTNEIGLRIMDVAAKLFSTKGFENTTTRDIAKAAGISNSAMYYHYKNKEQLLFEILNQTITKSFATIKQIAKSNKGLEEKLHDIMDVHTRDLATDTYKMKLMSDSQKSLTGPHKQVLNKKQRAYIKVFISILDELRKEGRIDDVDTTVCAFAYFGMISWTYRWYDPSGRIKPQQLSGIFNRIIMKGISSTKSSSPP